MRTQKIKNANKIGYPKPLQVKSTDNKQQQQKLSLNKRKLKVYYRYFQKPTKPQIPVILLQGKWLHDAGFKHGDEIVVTVNQRQLIINLQTICSNAVH